MQGARRLLDWRAEKRLYKEIVQAYILSDKVKEQQNAALRHTLSKQSRKLSPALMISSRFVPDAFSFVPISSTIALYTKCANNGRPHQVWIYNHTHSSHKVLYEETSSSCTVDVAVTRDGEFVTINSNSRTSSEVSIAKSHDVMDESCELSPVLLRPREERVEYYVEHAHNRFYILTNLGHDREYKLMTASSESPHVWDHYYQPEPGTVLQDLEVYEKGVVLYALREGAPLVVLIRPEDKEPLLLCGSEYTQIEKSSGSEYSSEVWPVWLSSPISPPTLYTLSPSRNVTEYGVKKDGRYCVERRSAVSKDGTEVPLTLCYHGDLLKRNQQNPILVHVYGCYGECVPTGYQAEYAPLLERGWVIVYSHTRGGGEKGRGWYYEGMGGKKHKIFEDLYACVQLLHRDLSHPELTALSGQSAGGLAVGMFCNLWPHLLQAAILEVPLVNLLHSLSDSAHYLSCKDILEFGGDPRASAKERDHISSLCPYSCLRPQDYPPMYISAASNDELIPFTGVCDYVTKLRECIAEHCHTGGGRGRVVFDVDEVGGHYGSGEWRERARKVSKQLLFLHKSVHSGS